MASGMGSTVVSSTADPTSMLNTQLASALSTLSDAQFWEETISPSTIRNELSASDPSNPNSTPTLLKGMKWLLASISKGRDVSDFYPHVVKLVGATNMEVRKMVYMYLVQYADHNATTRELSLLSINSFQRGLADHEQLIRALALRVLSSIRIPDILQIQILGVQKCAKDRSPYVRKCAANALSKLAPRCDAAQREMLLDIMKQFLDDTSTMVLSTALIAFCELCPERLELLHSSFRKICHLLTDMDEWGQVVILDVMSRYCRTFFKAPRGWKGGTAEKIDKERRVRRKVAGIAQEVPGTQASGGTLDIMGIGSNGGELAKSTEPKKVKRRVVQRGFYSDEEDESGEEEVYEDPPIGSTLSTAMRQRNILGLPGVAPTTVVNMDAEEDLDLDEDHKTLLRSATPLLKSRNAGVVLGVCSLLYYCGVSSVKTRSAIGKALVRIHRGRREIQYVVLTSIRMLVGECPSAFAPFLNDFFVKALDPPYTRIIKIDILVALALEPAAIEAVLKELRTYIRNADKKFVCAAIRAVGRVAELARIVYDRHGQKSGDVAKERNTANRIALDCLYGLAVVTQTGDSTFVVGEAVAVMRNILVMLMSSPGGEGSLMSVDDPNQVQGFAIRRILLLLVNTLSCRARRSQIVEDGDEDDDDDHENETSDLESVAFELPPFAMASALWIIGEWMTDDTGSAIRVHNIDSSTKSQMRLEVIRLIDKVFPDLVPPERDQALHFATKLILCLSASTAPSSGEIALCEHILSMGRIDVNPDVKDQARMASALIHGSIGLKHDIDNMDSHDASSKRLSIGDVKRLLLERKPTPSFLPIEDDKTVDTSSFRFGTLSSLVGHQARGTYLPLPPWAEKNSPAALRDPIAAVREQVSGVPASQKLGSGAGFYGPSDSESEDSDSSTSSSDESSEGQEADSESDSDSEDSSSSTGGEDVTPTQNTVPNGVPTFGTQPMQAMAQVVPTTTLQTSLATTQSSSEDESSDDSSSSSSTSSSNEDYGGDVSGYDVKTPREGNLLSMGMGMPALQNNNAFGSNSTPQSIPSSSAMDDLKGLVMAPIAVEESTPTDPDVERDSSAWIQLVRPELCGGLSARARYLRGPTKSREAQLKGLDPKQPNVICVQIEFGNKKSDSNPLRRIRVLPRSGNAGPVAVKKALCPPEIPELKKGQVSVTTIAIEFASASNRDGDMIARFHIQSSTGGSVPVELKPSLGELLVPQGGKSIQDFDGSMDRMQGFQRVTSKFQTNNIAIIPQVILKHAALTPVGKSGWNDNKLRFVAGLPASSDLVWVRVDIEPTSGSGIIIVCCDHAVAVNSMMNVMKQAVAQGIA